MRLLDIAPIKTDGSHSTLIWAIVAVLFVLFICLFFVWRYWKENSYRRL